MKSTVLLVDDHPVFRKGIRYLLEDEEDINIVGEAGDGETALGLIKQLSPDVVIMDISMPGLSGIETTRQITVDFPGTRVVALSIHSGQEFVNSMLQAGAAGYILKESVPEELVNGIRSILSGQGYLSPAVTGMVVSAFKNNVSMAEAESNTIVEILETKLHVPPHPPHYTPRPRLIELLEKNRNHTIQCVTAPAGYGKSTLVSSWVTAHDWPCSWLSLDKLDNNLRHFTIYLVHAVNKLFPEALSKTGAALETGVLPTIQAIASMFANEINSIKQDFLLVLDDLHVIGEKSVHDLITEIYRHPSPRMHLICIGRTDPFLPISKFRAQGLFAEIRMRELRFTNDEALQFLTTVSGQDIDEPIAIDCNEKMEGWITGLRLAALSNTHSGDWNRLLESSPGGLKYVKEYMFDEILKKQPESIRDCMINCAIVPRFCAPLIDALCPSSREEYEKDGWALIKWFLQQNLFQISLDNEGYWYRFHHLFQELLLGQLKRNRSPEEIARLYKGAGSWLAENGYFEDAVATLVAGGFSGEAGKIVGKIGYRWIDHEKVSELEMLLHQLPAETIQADPLLLIYEAWIARINVLIPEMGDRLDKAERILLQTPPEPSNFNRIWGYLNTVRGFQKYCLLDPEEAQHYTTRALEQLPSDSPYMTGFAFIVKAAALQMAGKYQEARASLDTALSDPSLQTDRVQALLLSGLCPICMMEADIAALQLFSAQLLSCAKKTGAQAFLSRGRFFTACGYYLQDKPELAEKIFADDFDYSSGDYPHMVAEGAGILALSHQLSGRVEEARSVADALTRFALEIEHRDIVLAAQALVAELALQQGRTSDAVAWARVCETRTLRAHYYFFLPELTLAKILIIEDTPESRGKALVLLSGIEDFARNTCNYSILIRTLGPQAILLGRHDIPAAVLKITEALSLAEAGGSLRFFLDYGKPMQDLLTTVRDQLSGNLFLERVLAAFAMQKTRTIRTAPAQDDLLASAADLSVSRHLSDTLTERETEILGQLVKGKTNKEIGEELFISTDTVKSHLKKIYQKLDVNSRLQAVSKANTMGLFG